MHHRPETVACRPPEDFCLPPGYAQQTAAHSRDDGEGSGVYWTPERIEASSRYQHHVYAWGARLIRDGVCARVLDIGCGPGTKLAEHFAPPAGVTPVEGWDLPGAVAIAAERVPTGVFRAVDLESPPPAEPRAGTLILCADVIEHLIDPDPLVEVLGSLCGEGSRVLLSTPCRDRLRGRACDHSPKPEHVREWAEPEFLRYLASRSLRVLESRLLPGEREPIEDGLAEEARFVAGEAPTSPHRCHAALCVPQ